MCLGFFYGRSCMEMSSEERVMPEALPGWYREFRTLFDAGAGHCFILHGDVHGVTPMHGASQLQFMQGMLHDERRDIVVYYHRALGISFPLPSMRALALELLGPDWSPPAAEDNLAAALEASGLMGQTFSQRDVFDSARRPREALVVLEALLRAERARGRVAVILDSA